MTHSFITRSQENMASKDKIWHECPLDSETSARGNLEKLLPQAKLWSLQSILNLYGFGSPDLTQQDINSKQESCKDTTYH